jgi:CubicO group peptidase (beta-lactamase class C family)
MARMLCLGWYSARIPEPQRETDMHQREVIAADGQTGAQSGAASGNRALKAAVDKLVQETGIKSTEPGIAVLAMRPGRILLMQGYGLANLATGEAITPCTRFELASASKPITATAVLILQEHGLLSIDDDVRKFIPELPRYPDGPLRIRDMLHHVSGLTNYLELEAVPKSNETYWINTDYLAALGKAPLDFPIGQRFEYNNTNYMLMAIVIERTTGKPFGDVLREEIFVPAGMTNTFVYSGPASIPANAASPCSNAIGYEQQNGGWVARWGFPPRHRQPEHLEVGDGAIWSNLEDMAKWDAAVRTSKLIKPATMKAALTGSREGKSYGLGWYLYHDEDSLYGYGHDGHWEGFSTMYYNYLTDNHSVVLLSNRGQAIDLNAFWAKLKGLIETHAKE